MKKHSKLIRTMKNLHLKLLCTVLCTVLCMVLALTLFSCTDNSATGGKSGGNDLSFQGDPDFRGDFTCTANGPVRNDTVSVTVSEEYVKYFGTDIVNVYMEGLKEFGIVLQDEISISVVSIKEVYPPLVTASEVKITKKNYSGFPCGGYGPYQILTLDDVTFPDNFPSISELQNGTSSKWYSSNFFFVCRTEKNIAYLSSLYSGIADFVLKITDARSKLRFSPGDHIEVQFDKCLKTEAKTSEGKRTFFSYAETISDNIKILTTEETEKAYRGLHLLDKPVIYLYPEQETTVSVRLDLDGVLTCTYPDYGNGEGWRELTVTPDGIIRDASGRSYYCLYWEGISQMKPDLSRGFCVRGEDTAKFLEKALADIGLNEREANEFIIYWLPQLQKNKYNVISFQTDAYTDTAVLTVDPQPESILRVFMSYYASENPVELEPQEFPPFERRGFTVVEWGGGEYIR